MNQLSPEQLQALARQGAAAQLTQQFSPGAGSTATQLAPQVQAANAGAQGLPLPQGLAPPDAAVPTRQAQLSNPTYTGQTSGLPPVGPPGSNPTIGLPQGAQPQLQPNPAFAQPEGSSFGPLSPGPRPQQPGGLGSNPGLGLPQGNAPQGLAPPNPTQLVGGAGANSIPQDLASQPQLQPAGLQQSGEPTDLAQVFANGGVSGGFGGGNYNQLAQRLARGG